MPGRAGLAQSREGGAGHFRWGRLKEAALNLAGQLLIGLSIGFVLPNEVLLLPNRLMREVPAETRLE